MDIDFTKIPPTLEQQTVVLLTEIRDLLKTSVLRHTDSNGTVTPPVGRTKKRA